MQEKKFMVFSSMTFLCVFLPAVFLLYYVIPSLACRNLLLIIFSLLFYAYGEPVYVMLMIVSTVMNYVFGRLLGGERQGHRRWSWSLPLCVIWGCWDSLSIRIC